jgi:hypothetical protein
MVLRSACAVKLEGAAMGVCAECGFLAIRAGNRDAVREALAITRERGLQGPESARGTARTAFCYVASKYFPEFSTKVDEQEVAGKLNRLHSCEEDTEYLPGRSPQEHLKMQELQQQREFNAQMLAEERAWKEQDRKDRAEEAEKVAERHRKDSKDANTRFWLGFVLAIVVTVAARWIEHLLISQPVPRPPNVIVNTGEPSITPPSDN